MDDEYWEAVQDQNGDEFWEEMEAIEQEDEEYDR